MYMKIFTVFCAALTFGLFVSFCNAQIDSEKIVGIWLLDETNGDTAEDASETDITGQSHNQIGFKGKLMGLLT